MNAPTLTNESYYPSYGYVNATLFSFIVNYTDLDNNAPSYITCIINSTLYEMSKLDIYDDNYMDGCLFVLNLMFEKLGSYVFTLNCSDGETDISLGPFTGLEVKSSIFFDNLFIEYSFETGGGIYDTMFTYTFHSGDLFTNQWDIWVPELYTGFWQENITTRIISNPSGMITFGSGGHTPVWIFPDVSIGENVNISVINDGDHIFEVIGDIKIDIGDNDYVDAWILEDQRHGMLRGRCRKWLV